MLLIDLYVPLASIVAIIFCMHLFINPPGLPYKIVVAVLELVLAWFYRDYFKGLLVQKAVVEDAIGIEQKPAI